MPSLIIVSGPSEGSYYPVGKRTLIVGRDEACPIQVLDELISRKHIQIRCDGSDSEKHVVTDMKSANGMYVNGRKIDGEIVLADADMIEIGKTQIVYYTNDFSDRESAFSAYKQRGQKFKNTLNQE